MLENGSPRSYAWAKNVFGIAEFGSTPYEAVCAQRIVPMLLPPSPPEGAKVTSPNGRTVVVGPLLHRERHDETSLGIKQL